MRLFFFTPAISKIQPLLCTYYANTRDESKASRKTALAQTKCPEFLAAYTESMRKVRTSEPKDTAWQC